MLIYTLLIQTQNILQYAEICRTAGLRTWKGGGYYISNFTAFQQLNFVLQSRMKIFLGNILITDKINQILIKH